MNVNPMILIVPLRGPVELLATEKCIEPGPFPLEPEVIVIQLTSLMALHTQPAPVVTVIDPVPPVFVNV